MSSEATLPNIEQVKSRIAKLEGIRDEKIVKLDAETKSLSDTARESSKEFLKLALEVIREDTKKNKAVARSNFKKAASQWNNVLRAQEAELGKSDEKAECEKTETCSEKEACSETENLAAPQETAETTTGPTGQSDQAVPEAPEVTA